MKNIVAILFLVFSFSCCAQSGEKFPFYNNSVVLEFNSPPAYISNLTYSNFTVKILELPAFFLSYEGKIKNKFYFEGGIGLGNQSYPGSFFIYLEPIDYKYFCATVYGGAMFKCKLFKFFYFTPSLELYYTNKRSGNDTLSYKDDYLTLGPTIGFEYFISKRISMNMDLLNVNVGYRFYDYNQYPTYVGSDFEITAYKFASLGIHYNFNWKKNP